MVYLIFFDDQSFYKSVTIISLCFTIINTKPETNLSNVVLFNIVYTHPLHIFRTKATQKNLLQYFNDPRGDLIYIYRHKKIKF